MTNKQLAEAIYNYIPYWEMPYITKKDNLKCILEDFKTKQGLQAIYNYLYEDDASENLQRILNVLSEKIKGLKWTKNY